MYKNVIKLIINSTVTISTDNYRHLGRQLDRVSYRSFRKDPAVNPPWKINTVSSQTCNNITDVTKIPCFQLIVAITTIDVQILRISHWKLIPRFSISKFSPEKKFWLQRYDTFPERNCWYKLDTILCFIYKRQYTIDTINSRNRSGRQQIQDA